MRITFIVRKRKHANTALHNAAKLDGQYLANLGHDVAIVEVDEFEVIADETIAKLVEVVRRKRNQ